MIGGDGDGGVVVDCLAVCKLGSFGVVGNNSPMAWATHSSATRGGLSMKMKASTWLCGCFLVDETVCALR